MFNWLKLKTISPRALYRNRLFIERDSKTRRVMSNFGLTFRNSKWSDYSLNNVSRKSVDQAKRFLLGFITIVLVLFLVKLNFFYYSNIQILSLLSVKEFTWLWYDYSTLSLILLISSYQLTITNGINFFYESLLRKLLVNDRNKPSIVPQHAMSTTALLEKQIAVPTLWLQELITTALTVSPNCKPLLNNQLILQLYSNTLVDKNSVNSLFFFKSLFTATELLLKTQRSNLSTQALTIADKQSNWIKLLVTIDFQAHTNLISNYFTSKMFSTKVMSVNSLNTMKWALVSTELELSKYQTKKNQVLGLFYYSSLDMSKLGNFESNTKHYNLWNNSIKQQIMFFKWMRWLYRYNILHRNIINYSHKTTNIKKLLSNGFFSSDITKNNLWVSNLTSTSDNNNFLVNSWKTLYRDIFQPNYNVNSKHSLDPLSQNNKIIKNLSFFEQSYFFYIQRFKKFNTLPQLLISSDLELNHKVVRHSHNLESFSNTTFLNSTLRSYSFLNKHFLTYKLNKFCLNTPDTNRNVNSNNKDIFMLETTKNFLSNNTDLDILNNLTELKRDDVTSLKYFSHSTTPSVNNSSTLWSWSTEKFSKKKQNLVVLPYLDSIYTKDLKAKSKLFL